MKTEKEKYHFIAIGGSIMHSLAIALKNAGHQVTGSDDAIYGVSKENLINAELLPESEGWDSRKITEDLDCIILGMHAREDNPELLQARNIGLPIMSFPEFVYNWSKEKTRVVITGSHGKTTISAMCIHVLKYCNISFDYILGASPAKNMPLVKLSNAPFIIIEGDEYLTSPLDARPKFLHYHADILLLNGIAWDHANVFPTWEKYTHQFDLLLQSTHDECSLIYYSKDSTVTSLVEKSNLKNKTPYSILKHSVKDGTTYLMSEGEEIALKIFGDHNIQNMAGAFEILMKLGINSNQFLEAIQDFEGAWNRLNLIHEGFIKVFSDFAHSPSKVKATVEAVSNQTPDNNLMAVLEIHTFSSLSKSFLPQYKDTMIAADKALVYFSPEVVSKKKLPELSKSEIQQYFGSNVAGFTDISDLKTYIKKHIKKGQDLLFMSSGNFEGMDLNSLVNELEKNET